MKVFNLRCAHQHVFEGWFSSLQDFENQQAQSMIQCPICGSAQVVKALAAPHIQRSASRSAPDADTPTPSPARRQPASRPPSASPVAQAVYERLVQHVLTHTRDVGHAFAQQVRQMHAGDMERQPIRGYASAQEVQDLRDEGIDVLSLPVPEASRHLLQ